MSKDLDESVLRAAYTISNIERNTNTPFHDQEIRRRLFVDIADFLVHGTNKVQVSVDEYSTTYSVSVIVCDQERFYRLVEDEAGRIVSRMGGGL